MALAFHIVYFFHTRTSPVTLAAHFQTESIGTGGFFVYEFLQLGLPQPSPALTKKNIHGFHKREDVVAVCSLASHDYGIFKVFGLILKPAACDACLVETNGAEKKT